ncbi:MAG: hypothetical protein ACE5I1_32535, partial [bacterium]
MSKPEKDKKSSKKKKKKEKYEEGSAISFSTVKRVYQVFGDLYKEYWKLIALAYLALFATIGVSLLAPWPMKLILDYVILEHPLPEEAKFLTDYTGAEPLDLLIFLVIAFVLIRLADSVVSYIHKIGMLIVRAKMAVAMRER